MSQAVAIAALPEPAAAAAVPPRVRRRDPAGFWISVVFLLIMAVARLLDVNEDGPAMMLFGVVYTAAVACVAVLRPRWFPLLAASYLPFSRAYSIVFAGIPGANMINVLLGFGVVAAISASTRPRPRLRTGLTVRLVVLYVALGALSIYPTMTSGVYGVGEVIQIYRSWVAPILFFFLVLALVRDRQDVADVVQIIACAAVVVSALTWVEGIGRQDRGTIDASRVMGLMRQANSMGAFLVYYGVPLLALALTARGWRRRLMYIGGYLIAARAMLFTFSRGAYLGMAAGSAMVVLLRSPLLLVAGAGGGLLTVAAFPRLIPSSVLERLGDTTVEDKSAYGEAKTFDQLDRSSAHRLVLWKGAAHMIAQYPLQGVGIGLFQQMIPNYTEVPLRKDDPRDAHNAFILLAAEMGLPELMMLLVLHLCFAVLALRLYLKRRMLVDRVLGLCFIGTQVGVLLSCMLGSRFSDEALITFFWMMAGMLCVVSRMREPLPPRKPRPRFAVGAVPRPATA